MHLWVAKNSGWVEVITGSMFSGKSEELIRRMRRAMYAGQKVIVFKHAIDKRYDEIKVVSHSKNEIDAVPVATAEGIKRFLEDDNSFDVIGIDEVQFFDSEIVPLIDRLADRGKRVIVAGLDQDFRGEPFHPMPEILARAEYVYKFNAICTKCGNPASRTQRLIDGKPAEFDSPVIMVGASEHYEARCRKCHDVPGKEREKTGKLYFIVGTDTGAGKTYITSELIKEKIAGNINVSVIKPVETGMDSFDSENKSDSAIYAEILGKKIEEINIYSYKKPLSPHFAAMSEGRKIEIEAIRKRIDESVKLYDEVYVEGAGGLMVPFNEGYTYFDLIREYGSSCEVIIVAKNVLGTINHTLLTVEMIKKERIKVSKVIFNNIERISDREFLEENARIVSKLAEVEVEVN